MNIDEEIKQEPQNQDSLSSPRQSRPALANITDVQNQSIPFFDINEVNIPPLIDSPTMSQASDWIGILNHKAVSQSQLSYLSLQEQMNHQALFDRYKYFLNYQMQSLGKLKFKYTADCKLKP